VYCYNLNLLQKSLWQIILVYYHTLKNKNTIGREMNNSVKLEKVIVDKTPAHFDTGMNKTEDV